MLAKRTIDEVMQQARVEEVISDFMTLRKRGINYEGLCPFHNEKSPSFKVNPVKGIYKCFGCGKAGSSVQFVMDHEGMSFIDAIKFLAAKYGIEVLEENTKRSEEYDELVRVKESLYAAIDFAQSYFVNNLHTEEGKIAGLSYLKERGFTTETIRKFGLGYAPAGFDNFTKTALNQGFKEQVLLDAGLIKLSEKGTYFDFFRERVQFPFYNVAGKIVAFGGRIIKKDERGPKYLNSPETPIYIKSKILFGIFQAKNAIKKTDMCYLVEGYTDVISLHQAGIENVVASSGTSLTEDQARLIARFSQNVTLLYDGDAAGIKASLRGIDILLAQALNVRVVLMENGEDPDSFARKNNTDQILQYLQDKVQDFILFKSKLLYADAGTDPIRKAEANAEVIRSIAIVPDPLKRAQYVQEFAQISGLNEMVLQGEIIKAKAKDAGKNSDEVLLTEFAMLQRKQNEINGTQAYEDKSTSLTSTENQELAIVKALIKFGDKPYKESEEQNISVAEYIIQSLMQDEAPFQNKQLERIVEHFRDQLENQQKPNIQSLLHSSDSAIATLIADTLDTGYTLSSKWEEEEILIPTEALTYKREVFDSVTHIKRVRLKRLMEETQLKLRDAESEEDKFRLLLQLNAMLNMRKTIAEILKTVVI